jgi:hypothetical protein
VPLEGDLTRAAPIRESGTFAPFDIPDRGESFFVTPTNQAAWVTFWIRFNNPGDEVIGRVFFQEFGGNFVRRTYPVVKYSETVTGDLVSFAAPGGETKL